MCLLLHMDDLQHEESKFPLHLQSESNRSGFFLSCIGQEYVCGLGWPGAKHV